METFLQVRTIAPVRVGAQGWLLLFPFIYLFIYLLLLLLLYSVSPSSTNFVNFRIHLLIINCSYCLYSILLPRYMKKKILDLARHEILPRAAHGSGIGDVSGIGKYM